MTNITHTLNQNRSIHFKPQTVATDYNAIIAIIKTNIEVMEKLFSCNVSHELQITEDFNLNTPSFNIENGIPNIYLCASEGNYWAQYVFQFSHELCHYFIDYSPNKVAMSIRKQDSWFEEVICEVSSRFFLIKMSQSDKLPSINYYLHSFKEYSLGRKKEVINFEVNVLSEEDSGYLTRFRDEIKNNSYANNETRYLYNHMANLIYPIFEHNDKLWQEVNLTSEFSDGNSFIDNLKEWKNNCQITENKESVEDIINLFSK